MQTIDRIFDEARADITKGTVATYIPTLATKNPQLFAITMIDEQQEELVRGDCKQYFTLQSVVKTINFLVAAHHQGLDKMMEFVDLEPTGDPFNSIIRLEGQRKPFNPMINAGAITVASLLPGDDVAQKVSSVLHYLEHLLQRTVSIDEATYESEYLSADQNRAIAYMLKRNGFLQCDAELALQTYLKLCAIEVTVSDLAKIALSFSNNQAREEQYFPNKLYRIARALMITCGMYDASGKFAAFVGLPAKSGVSGAIIAVVNQAHIEHLHGAIGIGIYGPSIDKIGNSVAGVAFLEQLVECYQLVGY